MTKDSKSLSWEGKKMPNSDCDYILYIDIVHRFLPLQCKSD